MSEVDGRESTGEDSEKRKYGLLGRFETRKEFATDRRAGGRVRLKNNRALEWSDGWRALTTTKKVIFVISDFNVFVDRGFDFD